ncbi:brachyurin-like [Frankliniella occidentalis]|uniref:Brachyurin-like n=1 Tax=Frankliniella occidentalis TaxID=133901 RepID=A0A6J1RW59_FRAOC|nr:brachyurin-like [Frankliniella occidentalis]
MWSTGAWRRAAQCPRTRVDMRVLVLLTAVVAAAAAAAAGAPPAHHDRRSLRSKLARVPALQSPAGPVGPAPASSRVGIEGGKVAAVGQFPWMANIVMDDTWVCGGALISDKHILTAAQCASGYARFLVTLGDVHTYQGSESFAYAYTYKSCWHEDYEEETHLNDIGIIELLYSVTFSENLRFVNLPSQSQASELFVGAAGTVSGFGMSETGFPSTDLLYAEQPILDNGLCARYLGKYVKSTIICGDGEGGVGTCSGDAGDPLVITNSDDGNPMLVGISSFQSDVDCSLGYPSAYTRVPAYLDWIQKSTSEDWACYPGPTPAPTPASSSPTPTPAP